MCPTGARRSGATTALRRARHGRHGDGPCPVGRGGGEGRGASARAAPAGRQETVQAASPRSLVEQPGWRAGLGGRVPAAAVDDAIGPVGELAELLRAEGTDVRTGAEGERIARPGPEVVGKLVTLTEVAGRLVGGHTGPPRRGHSEPGAQLAVSLVRRCHRLLLVVSFSSLLLNDDLDSEHCLP